MENDPSTPQLVSSTRTMEADLVEASVNTSSDEESFVLAEPSMPAETGDCMNSSVMTQSKYAQVRNKITAWFHYKNKGQR